MKSRSPKSPKRKICAFSGKRGGFGAYVPLMRLIERDPALELQILLGDMHTSAAFGSTVGEARALFPRAKIKTIQMGTGKDDTPETRAENLGVCMTAAARLLADLEPDMIMVHGDRGEHLVVALAAITLGIPVAHSQGGDRTGNIDEIIRHSITKLAHLHFPETKDAAECIARMGEEQWRIHTAGSLYIDRIMKKLYSDPQESRKKYGLGESGSYAILLYHPETYLSRAENYRRMREILKGVRESGVRSIVVYPCSDPGYEGIIKAIDEVRRDRQFLVHKNIANLDFLGLMAGASVMLGNSSTMIKEAPYLKLPALNFGERERGRFREENVIDCKIEASAIAKKIRDLPADKKFRLKLSRCGYHLGDGKASEKILDVVKTVPLNQRLLDKQLSYEHV